MKFTTEMNALKCGKFLIQTSAVWIESLWYPQYQILTDGLVTSPQQMPASIGFASTDSAIRAAFQHAIADLDFGASKAWLR